MLSWFIFLLLDQHRPSSIINHSRPSRLGVLERFGRSACNCGLHFDLVCGGRFGQPLAKIRKKERKAVLNAKRNPRIDELDLHCMIMQIHPKERKKRKKPFRRPIILASLFEYFTLVMFRIVKITSGCFCLLTIDLKWSSRSIYIKEDMG